MKTASGECSAGHITWGPNGYQCLNCGAEGKHSWDIKHDPKKNPQLRASLDKIAHIRHENGKWVIYSHDYKKKLGEYTSKEKATKRLRQIEYFKSHKGSLRPFSKKASEVMVDPYQALISQVESMRGRMADVQQRLESNPLPKTAGADEKDNSELSVEEVFSDIAMGLDLLEVKLKDEPESEELHKSLEELENLLWETEQKANITPKLSEEERKEPEHAEVLKEIENKEEVEASEKGRKPRSLVHKEYKDELTKEELEDEPVKKKLLEMNGLYVLLKVAIIKQIVLLVGNAIVIHIVGEKRI